jgi:hypothetical protein
MGNGPDHHLGESRADVYLPAVGYSQPRLRRYRARWTALLERLEAEGVDPRDWPYRPEGLLGKGRAAWWLSRWQLEGEGAVLASLEELWANRKGGLQESGIKRRRPGRPGWSSELFWQRLREAEGRTEPPRTTTRVAPNFDALDGARGIEPDSLARLIRRFGAQ